MSPDGRYWEDQVAEQAGILDIAGCFWATQALSACFSFLREVANCFSERPGPSVTSRDEVFVAMKTAGNCQHRGELALREGSGPGSRVQCQRCRGSVNVSDTR